MKWFWIFLAVAILAEEGSKAIVAMSSPPLPFLIPPAAATPLTCEPEPECCRCPVGL
jgi:hypothetical protein